MNNGTRASPLVPNVSGRDIPIISPTDNTSTALNPNQSGIHSTLRLPALCPEKQPSVHTQFTNKNSNLHSDHDGCSDLIPSSSNLNSSLLNQEHVTKFLDKLTRMRNSPATPKSSSKDFIRPASSCPPSWFAEEKLRVANSKLSTGKSVFQSGVGSLRTALYDISNGNMFGTQHSRNPTPNSCNRDLGKYIIMLEDDVEFVPDSYSPNSRPS